MESKQQSLDQDLDIEVLKIWSYHHRIVYLTRINQSYQLFYKSSGLAGHDSKGEVFPILLLKDQEGWSPDGFGGWNVVGWLPKLYVSDGRFQEYRYKRRAEFPESMHCYLDYLKDLDPENIEEALHPKEINKVAKKYIKSKEDYVDWK